MAMTEAERKELLWQLKREQTRRNLIAIIRECRLRAMEGLMDMPEDTRAYKRCKKDICKMDMMLRCIGG